MTTTIDRNDLLTSASVSDPIRGFKAAVPDTIAGHRTLLNLMKRAAVLTGARPQAVELQVGKNEAALFGALSQEACGRRVLMHDASRRDLFAMARHVAATINADDRRFDHYPDGWRADYDLVINGKPKPAIRASPKVAASRSKPNERHEALSAVNLAACELGCTEDDVLRRIRRTRASIRGSDVIRIAELIPEGAAGGTR